MVTITLEERNKLQNSPYIILRLTIIFNNNIFANAWIKIQKNKQFNSGYPCWGWGMSDYGVSFPKYKIQFRDFPGGPVVKNLPSNAGDKGSIPGQGTKIPHASGPLSPHRNQRSPRATMKTQCSQKKKIYIECMDSVIREKKKKED